MTGPTDTRTRTGKVLSTAVAMIVAVGAYAAAKYLMTPSDEQKAAELAAVLSDLAARENPASPRTMENGMVLLSVAAAGKDITYTYSVPASLESSVRFGGALRDEQMQSALCSGPARPVVQAGADFHYVYLKGAGGEELGRTTVMMCF